MATHTTHYNLTKPSQNDKVNIGVLNDNADIIDTALHNKVDSDDLTANNVMMSDGVTSVEDVVEELSKPAVGTTVDISTYNTASNYYECPSDGYVRILGTSSSTAWAYLLQAGTASNYAIAQSTGLYVAVPVRKGARVYVINVSNATFMPMTDYT